MAFDGNGNFVRLHNWQQDAANAIDISAPEMDAEDSGFAAGLSLCVTRDGQGKMAQDFLPSVDNTLNLGTAIRRWATLNGVPIANLPISQANVAALLFPATSQETTAGIVPNTLYAYNDIRRYNVVANNTGAAAANVTALRLLWNVTNGIAGRFIFPNTGAGIGGVDVYSFGDVIAPICDNVYIDLQGSQLSWTGSVNASAANAGLIFANRNFSIENGSISVAVDTSLATSSGYAIQLGSRGAESSYYTTFDASLAVPMGNITVRNMRLKVANTGTNLAGSGVLGMCGGLVNVVLENNVIDGGNTVPYGIFYEFGWATSPPSLSSTQTSHAHNIAIRNNKVGNLTTAAGGCVYLTGMYDVVIDDLQTFAACASCISIQPGEALFFNPWVGTDVAGAKRNTVIRSSTLQGFVGVGLNLIAAAPASSGYLSGAGLTLAQQTDLMSFSLDSVTVNQGTGNAMVVTGPIVARNCKFSGTGGGGNIALSDNCVMGVFDNCDVRDGGSTCGVRADLTDAVVWSPKRQKNIIWNGGLVAGNVGNGFQIGNAASFKITGTRIGYNALYDAANESIQTTAVLVDSATSTANGVVCDATLATCASGNAYVINGSLSGGCNLVNLNPQGNLTNSGAWMWDGTASDTAANIASKTSLTNTSFKYPFKRCWDTTNNRLMLAQGSSATSNWIAASFGTTITTVTPS